MAPEGFAVARPPTAEVISDTTDPSKPLAEDPIALAVGCAAEAAEPAPSLIATVAETRGRPERAIEAETGRIGRVTDAPMSARFEPRAETTAVALKGRTSPRPTVAETTSPFTGSNTSLAMLAEGCSTSLTMELTGSNRSPAEAAVTEGCRATPITEPTGSTTPLAIVAMGCATPLTMEPTGSTTPLTIVATG